MGAKVTICCNKGQQSNNQYKTKLNNLSPLESNTSRTKGLSKVLDLSDNHQKPRISSNVPNTTPDSSWIIDDQTNSTPDTADFDLDYLSQIGSMKIGDVLVYNENGLPTIKDTGTIGDDERWMEEVDKLFLAAYPPAIRKLEEIQLDDTHTGCW